MTQKDRKETKTILIMADLIEREVKRIFKEQEFQIRSLKIENKQLRNSLEKVEADAKC